MDDAEFKRASWKCIISTLDGNVQSQGIKARFPEWMVIGSPEWDQTPDKMKAYAYQAAKATGWSDKSLIEAVCSVYEHIDEFMAKFTLSVLEDLKKEYPLEVEDMRLTWKRTQNAS